MRTMRTSVDITCSDSQVSGEIGAAERRPKSDNNGENYVERRLEELAVLGEQESLHLESRKGCVSAENARQDTDANAGRNHQALQRQDEQEAHEKASDHVDAHRRERKIPPERRLHQIRLRVSRPASERAANRNCDIGPHSASLLLRQMLVRRDASESDG